MILKVNKGQNPYYVIERYIYEHTEVMEEMIAVLEIDGERTNELLEVDSYYDGWIWLNDWWEGEPEIALIDFFPVSEACNPKNVVPFKWTPCSERLPEETGTYLVTINYHGNTYVSMDNFSPSGWELTGWTGLATRLAWAKVPEPYKGETE